MHQPLQPVTDAADQPDFVTALARGLAVIRAFGTHSKRLSLAEIARHVNLPRATVRRSLITLETLGYVESDGKTFMLTPHVLSLGYSYLASMPVTRAVRPRLERMSALLNEGSSAGILDRDDAVFVARVPVRHVVRESMTPGSRIPAFCTSMGRVLLAGQPDQLIEEYLSRIEPRSFTPRTITDRTRIHDQILAARQNAYSIVEEELDAGVLAISVPIKDTHDRTVAAIGITSHIDRMTRDRMLDQFLPLMRDAVKEIRAELV